MSFFLVCLLIAVTVLWSVFGVIILSGQLERSYAPNPFPNHNHAFKLLASALPYGPVVWVGCIVYSVIVRPAIKVYNWGIRK